MSESGADRPDGHAIFSERLLGLQSECPVCSGPETSTGWLLRRDGAGFGWYVDLRCGDCGSRGGTWKREWQDLIGDVLESSGDA